MAEVGTGVLLVLKSGRWLAPENCISKGCGSGAISRHHRPPPGGLSLAQSIPGAHAAKTKPPPPPPNLLVGKLRHEGTPQEPQGWHLAPWARSHHRLPTSSPALPARR